MSWVSGYKTTFMTEVKTTSTTGIFYDKQEFLILNQDGEDLVMGIIWFDSVMTAKRSKITKIVDIRGFGIQIEVPIEFSQNVAPKDELLENSNSDAYPSQVSEPWEMCTFNHKFPELERLKSIVKSHGSFFLLIDATCFAEVDNLWGYHQLRLTEDSS